MTLSFRVHYTLIRGSGGAAGCHVRTWWACARARGIHGPAQTPFMLRHMAEHSQGATVRVNCALAIANARLAGPPPRAEWADCYKLA